MSKIIEADSAPPLLRFAIGGLVQFWLKCPLFPHRKQIGEGLLVPLGAGLDGELCPALPGRAEAIGIAEDFALAFG